MRALNILLGCMALGFVYELVGLWVEPLSSNVLTGQLETDGMAVSPDAQHERVATDVRPPMPPLSEYQLIVERDPFRQPQEPVTVPPKPVSAPVAVVPPIPKASVPPPPLPPLSVTLSGTVAIGDERKAILKDGKQEDVYVLGQHVAGGVLETIETDRVVIARGSERTELLMKSAIKSAQAPLALARGSQKEKSDEADDSSDRAAAVAQGKKKKILPSNKFLFSTPAFARYPGANQGSGR